VYALPAFSRRRLALRIRRLPVESSARTTSSPPSRVVCALPGFSRRRLASSSSGKITDRRARATATPQSRWPAAEGRRPTAASVVTPQDVHFWSAFCVLRSAAHSRP